MYAKSLTVPGILCKCLTQNLGPDFAFHPGFAVRALLLNSAPQPFLMQLSFFVLLHPSAVIFQNPAEQWSILGTSSVFLDFPARLFSPLSAPVAPPG